MAFLEHVLLFGNSPVSVDVPQSETTRVAYVIRYLVIHSIPFLSRGKGLTDATPNLGYGFVFMALFLRIRHEIESTLFEVIT